MLKKIKSIHTECTATAAAVSSVYKPGGSISTISALPDITKEAAANHGKIYNIEAAFTTTADFVEGAGKKHPAGTNVVIVDVGTAEKPSYKYDVLVGVVELMHDTAYCPKCKKQTEISYWENLKFCLKCGQVLDLNTEAESEGHQND